MASYTRKPFAKRATMEKEGRPILLPDGSRVVKGMPVFKIYGKDVYDNPGTSTSKIKKWSGTIAKYLVEYAVVAVNEAEASRSFVLRSDKGCESTYSVKGSCLPEMFGSRKKAVSELVKQEKEAHVKRIEARISSKFRYIKSLHLEISKMNRTRTKLLKNLSKVK